jgi:Flp pilus assembly protein TadD
VHLKLGNMYYRRGALEEARASWEQALTLDPGNRIVMANLSALPTREQPATELQPAGEQEDDALAAFGLDA